MVSRHRVRSSGTGIKAYVLLTVICGVAVLAMRGFIMLTESAKEGLEDATKGVVNSTIQAEIQEVESIQSRG